MVAGNSYHSTSSRRKRNKGTRAYHYSLRPTSCGCPWPLSDVQSPETRKHPAVRDVHSSGRKTRQGRNPRKKEMRNGDAPNTSCCAGRRRVEGWTPRGLAGDRKETARSLVQEKPDSSSRDLLLLTRLGLETHEKRWKRREVVQRRREGQSPELTAG